MDFRTMCAEELEDYGRWQYTIENMEYEVNMLTDHIGSTREYCEGLIVGHPVNSAATDLLGRSLERVYKLENLQYIKNKSYLIENALSQLDTRDRYVLEKLFVDRIKSTLADIAAEFGIEPKAVGKIRDLALDEYCKLRCGVLII